MIKQPWSNGDSHRVALALGAARDVLVGMGRAPLGPDIVFTVLEQSVDIERRLQVRGGPARVKSLWPDYIRDYEERVELDIDGPIKLQVMPAEVSMMESVNLVFRHCLVGRNQARDMKILHRLAEGRQFKRDIGKAFRITGQRVSDIRDKQLQALWKRLKSLLPEQSHYGALLRAA